VWAAQAVGGIPRPLVEVSESGSALGFEATALIEGGVTGFGLFFFGLTWEES
jgi:hypothetical protein